MNYGFVFVGLWDSLLKGRIELQKVVSIVNQLPQPDKWNKFVKQGEESYQQLIKEGQLELVLICISNNPILFVTTLYIDHSETCITITLYGSARILKFILIATLTKIQQNYTVCG